jgi:8-oxo-dGTP pyrophosphatase MutT (NUDIX family)
MGGRLPVPRWLGVRAAEVAAGQRAVTEPRDAATVVLLRPDADGFEVLLLGRARAMDFAPGAHVFPGGSVDPGDGAAGVAWAADLAPVLDVPAERCRAIAGAAVRETAEECGVRLAGALVPWGRWITPEVSERRYDTWFFVAAMPPGQVADIASTGGAESESAVWLPPGAALDAARRGEITLLPPTAVTLAELAGFATVDEVLAQRRTITPRMPAVHVTGDDAWLAMPDGVEYPL